MIRVLLLILVLLALVSTALYLMLFRPNPNDTLKNMPLQNLAGDVVMSETLYDEDAVINYFSAECGNCPNTMSLLESARNAKNTTYSTINYSYIYFGDDADAARTVAKELDIPEELVFLDKDAEFMQSFGGRNLPLTLFVDAGGQVELRRSAIPNANFLIVSLKKFLR